MRRPWRRLLRLTLLSSIGLFLSCEEACKVANNVNQFIDSISDGAPCEGNGQCLGGRCFTPEQGFPGGYCSTLECDVEGCSGLSSECFREPIDGQTVTACFELCDFDGACDRADEGYICVDLQDTAVCMPPGVSSAGAQGTTGSACSSNPQCNGDNAVCLTSSFNGYCSQTCTADSDCLGGNPCLEGYCFLACQSDDECRFQYACLDYDGVSVCNRGEAEARNPQGADDGAKCVSQINCKGGACIVEAEVDGEVKTPGGYCTTRDCASDEDCNGGVCVSRGIKNACLAGCATDGDCRTGYSCVETPNGSVCDTDFDRVTPDTSEAAFYVQCGPSKTFDFTVPAGSVGFFVGPYTRDGKRIEPRTLTGPNNYTLDIVNDYSFLAINPDILGSLAPIMFPGTDDKQTPFRAEYGAGDWSLTVETNSSDICFYMIPQPAVGTVLHVNLYLVGVPGLTASQAKTDGDIGEVMEVVTTIYDKMNVTASIANYIDATPSVAASYSIIRDFNDVFNLVATSTPQGSSAEDQLTVNVFLIDDFNVSEAKGLLGVSSGIPGMAGLHGNNGAGLVFSSASLGSDNQQLGQTMAHEIGHFLGLRHTTEHGLIAGHDPITDTPDTCVNANLANLCADSDNFMFAFALGGSQQVVTPGQSYVVTRNPLVK